MGGCALHLVPCVCPTDPTHAASTTVPTDAFPQDYYPAPRPLRPAHLDAYQLEAAELWGAWQKQVQTEGSTGNVTPAARLHATLMLQQLEDTGSELQRLYSTARACIDNQQSSMYGFFGCPCCHVSS